MAKNKISKFFLESGKDLYISSKIHCKHPTLQEISDIDKDFNGYKSQEIYDSYISIFMTDPYDFMVYLDDKGIDYEQVTPFDVFCMKFTEYMDAFEKLIESMPPNENENEPVDLYDSNIYFRSFKFFFDIDRFYSFKQDGEWYLIQGDGSFLMDSEIYEYIYEFIRGINGVSETKDKINPENEDYKRILIEDKRDEEKRKRAKKDNEDDEEDDDGYDKIGSKLSALLWVTNGSISPFDKFKLHIYDLIAGVDRYNKFINYENHMISIYTGKMDSKKLDLNKMHWAH